MNGDGNGNGKGMWVDRTLSVAAIVALVGMGIWVGRIDTQVEVNRKWIETNQAIIERLAVVEIEVSEIRRIVERIEAQVSTETRPSRSAR